MFHDCFHPFRYLGNSVLITQGRVWFPREQGKEGDLAQPKASENDEGFEEKQNLWEGECYKGLQGKKSPLESERDFPRTTEETRKKKTIIFFLLVTRGQETILETGGRWEELNDPRDRKTPERNFRVNIGKES